MLLKPISEPESGLNSPRPIGGTSVKGEPPLTDEKPTFICIDCGIPVYRMVETHANDEDICVECKWLRDIEDPKEREELRKFLKRDRT